MESGSGDYGVKIEPWLQRRQPSLGANTPNLNIVGLDEKGRALLPSSLRKRIGARRFEVKSVEGGSGLIPLEGLRSLKGKYRNRRKSSWAKLEENAESFVADDKGRMV